MSLRIVFKRRGRATFDLLLGCVTTKPAGYIVRV